MIKSKIMSMSMFSPLYIWAARDVLRRPGEALLLGVVLALIITVSATALLLTRSISHTAMQMIQQAPSLVVRQAGPGGWQPLDAEKAIAAARQVAGVINPRVRIWGVVNAGDTPLTLVGAEKSPSDEIAAANTAGRMPGRGEAIAGLAAGCAPGGRLILSGQRTASFEVIGTFDRSAGMAAHDVVLVPADDARQVLGLPPGYASDLALDVFHDSEQDAILPDLSAAFGFPVTIATRDRTAGYYAAAYDMRGGVFMTALIPALLALVLIMVYTGRESAGRSHEIGLLKSMGWTTGNIAALQAARSILIALPASAAGMAAAYALVFRPGNTWPAAFFFGWEKLPPGLFLDAAGAAAVLVEISALVVAPYAAAALWSTLRHAAAAPMDLIEMEE